MLDGTCFTRTMSLFARFILALSVCLICLPLESKAAPGSTASRDVQEAEACSPLNKANERVLRTPAIQVTDHLIRYGDQPGFLHQEEIYIGDMVYSRRQPFGRWIATARPPGSDLNPDGTPINRTCSRVGEEKLDGINTVVIRYDKMINDQHQSYRCTTWLETPKYRPLKMVCKGPFEWTRYWFYRTDIKPPMPPPK